jgi:hypothetical protein
MVVERKGARKNKKKTIQQYEPMEGFTYYEADYPTYRYQDLEPSERQVDEWQKNPVEAVSVLIEGHRKGYVPPRTVLEWLVRGFERYQATRRKVSLEGCLGFRAKRGQRHPFFEQAEFARDVQYCREMCHAIHCLGLSLDEAAYMVAEIYKDKPPFTPGYPPLPALADSTLREKYVKRWKYLRSDIFEHPDIDRKNPSPAEKAAYLKTFPTYTIPSRLHPCMTE